MPPKPEQPESIGEQVRAAADVFSQLQGTAEGAGSSITPEVSVMPKVQEVKTADSADAAVVAPSAPEVKQEPQDTHTVSDAMRQLEAADPVPTEMPMRAESIEAPQDKKKVAIAVEADTAPKHQESPDETTKSVEPEERIFGTGQAIFSVPLSMPEAMEKKRAEYNKQRSEASEKKDGTPSVQQADNHSAGGSAKIEVSATIVEDVTYEDYDRGGMGISASSHAVGSQSGSDNGRVFLPSESDQGGNSVTGSEKGSASSEEKIVDTKGYESLNQVDRAIEMKTKAIQSMHLSLFGSESYNVASHLPSDNPSELKEYVGKFLEAVSFDLENPDLSKGQQEQYKNVKKLHEALGDLIDIREALEKQNAPLADQSKDDGVKAWLKAQSVTEGNAEGSSGRELSEAGDLSEDRGNVTDEDDLMRGIDAERVLSFSDEMNGTAQKLSRADQMRALYDAGDIGEAIAVGFQGVAEIFDDIADRTEGFVRNRRWPAPQPENWLQKEDIRG